MPIWRTYQSISKPKKFSKVFEYTNIRYGLKSNSIQNGGNINQIAKKEDINVETVRRIFSATENIVFDYLSSTTPSENVVVKILNGLSLTGKYIPEKEIHTYDDIKCEERISVKPRVTRYYNRKINNYF